MSNIESSFLYTREDGSQDTIHDTYRDFFLAKWFAIRLNDGRLTARNAWIDYFSYEEDAELWGLPQDQEWRAMLPDLENVLLLIFPMLKQEKKEEFIYVLSEGYSKAKETLDSGAYNPLEDNYRLVSKVEGKEEPFGLKLGKEVIDDNLYLGSLEKTLLGLDFVNGEMSYKEPRYDIDGLLRWLFEYRENMRVATYILEEEVVQEKQTAYQILRYIKDKYMLQSEDYAGHVIRTIHQRLKPRGYNPPVKKLVA